MSDERPRVLVELGIELDRAAREHLPSESAARQPWAKRRRWWRWRAAPVLAVVVLGGAAAAFASGLFSLGSPVKPTPVFSDARAGLGALIPGTVKLLPVATADPDGGPAWGLRVLSTTRGAGCVQVGRLVDGKLVALGQDGAFGDDGRAHALPTSVAINSFSCALLDRKGQLFNSVTMLGQTASAAWWFRSTSCVPTGTPRATNSAHPACPLSGERDVYYGLLGPQATSITYTIAGQSHTQATVGPHGAYLIVTDVSAHQRIPGAGGGTADDVPVFSPITSIQYRNGATCHLLTTHKWIVGFHACAPSLKEPIGYVPATAPTQAQVAATIHARVIHTSVLRVPARIIRTGSRAIHVPAQAIRISPRYVIEVTFKSRIALTSLRASYQLEWHTDGTGPKVDGYTQIGDGSDFDDVDPDLGEAGSGGDVVAGQTLTATIDAFGPKLAPGVTHGTITVHYSTGPSLDGSFPTAKIPVGSFTVNIP